MITVSYSIQGFILVLDEALEMNITDKGGAGSNQESTVANGKDSITSTVAYAY